MKFKFLFWILISTQASIFGATAWGQEDSQKDLKIRESIQAILQVRHPTEDGNWWRSLGPQAPRIIMEMYENSTNIYHRVRLMNALAWFDNPDSAQFMKKEMNQTSNQVIRNSAIQSVIRSRGMKEKKFISTVLENENPQSRIAAAEALGMVEEPEAQEMVSKLMSKEKDTWVGHRITEQRRQTQQVQNRQDRQKQKFRTGSNDAIRLEPKHKN
jgi:hypothetical protein